MPKLTIFHQLDFLSYVKRLHVSYHPGRSRSDVCRQIIAHMTSPQSKKNFPRLNASFDIVGYDSPSTVELELVNGKAFKFFADGYTLKEVQRQFDKEQFDAHVAFMQNFSVERTEDVDG
ncbi:hypothetical protein IE077_001747 [Cardiosporidium cionae]|uniref:KTSC domain-containing protein n=1 Tax=Cardiosporidium cionae TaxID=476202 RepID=A0ABQ7JCF5_9APIC|nr:hypothetical protein IE077_001747 [Cardiosporidium cionae]|eukprot:KAF8821664.1 hypothetical protein IE077_001747 [Cardiosporidium cionae]